MNKVFLYAHGGSKNHGCEAIVRSTIKILDETPILISSNPSEDVEYGVDRLCTVIKETVDYIPKFDLGFWQAYAALKLRKNYIPMEKMLYKTAFEKVQKGDLAFSIGGDNYCYADARRYSIMHDMLKQRKAKTILWGCSIDPELIQNDEFASDFSRYDLIIARESITYEALKKINVNTLLVPDPAFWLDRKVTKIPKGFSERNTVGINISPMVIENEKNPGITIKNFELLLNEILTKSDMNVALIPHVVCENSDDRMPLYTLYKQFKNSGRVVMIDDRPAEELKYIISKCRFFVGARTHATIAAYSSEVPTLALGYSVKAKGIARDLFGTEDGYVVPVQSIERDDEILNMFKKLIQKEIEIKQTLRDSKMFTKNNFNRLKQAIYQLR